MYALRERRVHVTQEDFEMAVAKVGARGEVTLGARGHKESWVVFAGSCRGWRVQTRACHHMGDTGEAAEPSLCKAETWPWGWFWGN